VLKPDFPVRTERLILRPYTLDDLDDLYAVQSRADVARYLYWAPRDRDEVRKALELKIRSTSIGDEDEMLVLAAELPETGRVIGEVVLIWTSREHRQGEVGYIFHPDHHGHGYATEATEVVVRLGFEGLGVHRLIGRLDGRNTASARVLERLGMRKEAQFVQNELVKGEWADEAVYAMLEDEWRARGSGNERDLSDTP
jgi:RimJ/RimL family protein N-acetyltransferase